MRCIKAQLQQHVIGVGAALGAASAALIATFGVLIADTSGDIAEPAAWAFIAAGASLLPGGVAGAIGTAFIVRRAPHVKSFPHLVAEAAGTGAVLGALYVAIGTIEGEELPGLFVVVIAVSGGLFAGSLISIVLRPVYWRPTDG